MAKLIEILIETQMIISIIFIVLAIYQLIICIVGLTKKKINKEYNFKEHKFMIEDFDDSTIDTEKDKEYYNFKHK